MQQSEKKDCIKRMQCFPFYPFRLFHAFKHNSQCFMITFHMQGCLVRYQQWGAEGEIFINHPEQSPPPHLTKILTPLHPHSMLCDFLFLYGPTYSSTYKCCYEVCLTFLGLWSFTQSPPLILVMVCKESLMLVPDVRSWPVAGRGSYLVFV